MIAAGIYTRYSETSTVARMYTLRSWSSYPREVSRANHLGSMMEPLQIVSLLILLDHTEDRGHRHSSKKPAMIGGQRRIIESPVGQVVEVPLGYWQMCGDLHPMPLSFKVAVHGRDVEACSRVSTRFDA